MENLPCLSPLLKESWQTLQGNNELERYELHGLYVHRTCFVRSGHL
jgi:hypothetical protein